MNKTQTSSPAFTLIELLLYVGITTFIVVGLMSLSLSLLATRTDVESGRELVENARLILNTTSSYLHDAPSVNTGTYGSHPGSITLDDDVSGTVTVDTATKTVGANTIRYIQIDGTQLSSDDVNVTNFVLTNLTRGSEPSNIQIELTLHTLDGLSSMDFRTSLSLREQ